MCHAGWAEVARPRSEERRFVAKDKRKAETLRPTLPPASCWLCERPLGRVVEWHHPLPKSRGGRDTVPVHPICHRTLHTLFSNGELARFGPDRSRLVAEAALARFLAWIEGKDPDFHAPTFRSSSRR